ncbi:hemicentin-1-like [Stylophora pistillata]|uniref:hemicentin-1-like n=1 Tax=Stylophora pistillata TaxID=50429 RepID=UPI000C04CAB1|nr:hemicentin-1-like [Stylophora pistillata]
MAKLLTFLKIVFFSKVFVPQAESQPVFTKVPSLSSYVVVEGNGLFLQWNYTLGGAFRQAEFDLLGTTGIDIVERFVSDSNAFIYPDYRGRVKANITATQTNVSFLSLTRKDTGIYAFQVIRNSDRKKISSSVRITVQYPPEFSNNGGDVVVTEGTDASDNINLECTADGEPTPNITWTKVYANGSDSDVLATGNQFVLANNRTNSGTYRCTAFNGIGTAPSHTLKVDVNFKPEIIKQLVSDSTVCEGDVINITCSADSRPAVHTYQLFENGIIVVDGNSSAGVWILRRDLKEGNFSYRCVVNNTISTTEETVNITVKVPSKVYPLENITVIEGENSTLTCNASGSPVLTVTWTGVSTGSQSNGIVHYLTKISRNASGEYKYEAINDCGHSSASTFLTVLFKPENFKFTVSKSTVCQGTVVIFHCSADGNPPVDTYQLLENDKPVSAGSNRLGMWSRNMSSGGVSIYKCMANNSAGTAYSMSLNVTVNECHSVFTKEPPSPSLVLEGNDLFLQWNYTLTGSLRNSEIILVTNGPITVAARDALDISQNKPALILDAFVGRVEGSITDVQTNVTFLSVNRTDSGKYRLQLEDSDRNPFESDVTVTVLYSPEFTSVSDDVVLVDGEGDPSITFECTADGEPTPSITWTRVYDNGSDSGVLAGESQFAFENKRTNSGTYRCTAYNGIGTAPNRTVKVEVYFKPEIIKLFVNDSTVCEGNVISITCSAYSRPEVHTYQLFENGILVVDGNSSAGVWISRRDLREGNFSYRCVANNTIGTTGETFSIAVKGIV